MKARRLTALAVLAAVALPTGLLAGCSGGAPESAMRTSGEGANDAAPAPKEPGADESGKAGGKSGEGSSSNRARVTLKTRDIIRVGTMTVQTKDPEGAAQKANALVSGTEGYVADQTSAVETDRSGPDSVTMTLRVPVDRFHDVRLAVRKLGKTLLDKHDAKDVTDEVADVDSRVKSQKRSIERLRTLMGKATTVGEVIQVESELSTRESELESPQSRQATLKSQTTLSTLTVTFQRPPDPKKEDPKGDDWGFLIGLRGGWDAFVTTVQVVLTALGAILPFVVVLALLLLAPVWWVLRHRRRTPAAAAPTAQSEV